MNTLYDFFDSDDLDENVMYYTEMHGLLTSLAIQSGNLTETEILDIIFAGNEHPPHIAIAINALQKDIGQSLLNGDFPDIMSPDDDDESLELWASGFMQGIFSQEELWFEKHPEEVAELTLPILQTSGLLDDDTDEISQNDDILDVMAEKIPDCAIDLYLLLNTPEGA